VQFACNSGLTTSETAPDLGLRSSILERSKVHSQLRRVLRSRPIYLSIRLPHAKPGLRNDPCPSGEGYGIPIRLSRVRRVGCWSPAFLRNDLPRMRFAGIRIGVGIKLFVHIITLSLAGAGIRIALYLRHKSRGDRYRLHGNGTPSISSGTLLSTAATSRGHLT
jgi:hypothetical protein